MDAKPFDICTAIATAAHDYLRLYDLAGDVFEADVEGDIATLHTAASQLGVSLTALGRRYAVESSGSDKEQALLRDLAESLLLMAVSASADEMKTLLLVTPESIRSQAAALGIALG